MYAVSEHSLICVACDHSVLVYHAAGKLMCRLEFDCAVERITVDPTASLLVVADEKGTVHFVHVPSSAIMYSQTIVTAVTVGPKFTFLKAYSSSRTGLCELLIVSTTMVLRLSNMSLQGCEKQLDDIHLNLLADNVASMLMVAESVSENRDS